MERWNPPAWALPLIVAAIVVPPFLGFALAGAAAGAALGFLVGAALIVIAVRFRPRGPIALASESEDAPLLALALAPIDDGGAASQVATLAEADREDGDGPAVLVLAPVQSTVTQRWLSDEEPGRVAAQERLAVSIATLTAAGCHAEGRVVSENPEQALEDVSAEHGARRLVFVVADDADDRLIEELRERVDCPVHRVEVGGERQGQSRAT